MSINTELWLVLAAVLLFIDVIIILKLIINKLNNEKDRKVSENYKDILIKAASGNLLDIKRKAPVSDYFELKQSVKLDKLKIENIEMAVDIDRIENKCLKGLNSIWKTKRIEAAVYLGLLGTDTARMALERSIIKEKDYTVRLYIANALSDIGNKESISVLIASLVNSPHFYRDRINMLIISFGGDFSSYLPVIINSEKIEIKELITDFAAVYFSKNLKTYLIDLIDNKDAEIIKLKELYGGSEKRCCARCIHNTAALNKKNMQCRFKGKVKRSYVCSRYEILPVSIEPEESYIRLVHKACEILAQYYPDVLDNEKYLNSEDTEIKNIAVKALSNYNAPDRTERLISFLKDEGTARSALKSLSRIIEINPVYIKVVAKAFNEEKDVKIKKELAKVLSSRIEYFIMKLSKRNRTAAAEIIKEIFYLGRTSEIIDFLNKNKDLDIENELIAIIRNVVLKSAALEKEFSRYLNERLARKCGISPFKETEPEKEEQKDIKLIITLYVLLASSFLIFPVIYCLRQKDILLKVSFVEQIKIFVIDFNYFFAFYSMIISATYLGLLILSYINVRKQVKLWKIKNMSLLFKEKILPSVSIIAPAFNEEKTIIESSNALLNLKYPDYELIIVNDGSGDNTLDVLIKYFSLKRADYVFDYKLNTKSVRGIYMNPSMPKLIVVDKANGGKADSLNTGINISNKEYFCSIGADSLLEDEALLKLASLILDEGTETPALGGNIFPVNGCTVERGQIKNARIPEGRIGRLQTIEYIRAFMAGRLGWAFLNSLLIISGAFGLFKKERVINAGGYLTSSRKYQKDTAGEDMELVVRISRYMRELGYKYRICYGFNANCWTEVPEDMSALKKQRYRCHKDLIDILAFHKKMLFNPAYGRTGIIAMPYFFIFEMMGPIVEMQGYAMVVLAFVLGLINDEIAAILFVSTILMGVLISIFSLLVAEKDLKHFALRDMAALIVCSIIENFGPRQIISFWRVGGYFSMMKKPGEWDKAQRKGFAVSSVVENA